MTVTACCAHKELYNRVQKYQVTEQTCLFLVLIIITLCSFFASCSTFSEGFYTKWFSMCVFTVINEDNDPSKLRELLLGGLFLFISENIHSSPAFLCNFKKSSRIVCQPSAHAHQGIKKYLNSNSCTSNKTKEADQRQQACMSVPYELSVKRKQYN